MANVFTWQGVKKFSENRTIRASYIWLIVVPIVANFLTHVESPVDLLGIKLNLTLPFSWKMFYVSAIVFSLANLLYFFFCPKIIKEYRSYNDFVSEGKAFPQLFLHGVNVIGTKFYQIFPKEVFGDDAFYARAQDFKGGEIVEVNFYDKELIDRYISGSNWRRYFRGYSEDNIEAFQQYSFHQIFNAANIKNQWAAIIAVIAHYVGLSIVTFLVGRGMIAVFYQL